MRHEQAIGALLICLITAIIGTSVMMVPRCFRGPQNDVQAFCIDSLAADSLQQQWNAAHPARSYTKRNLSSVHNRVDTIPVQMQYFDPNTADSVTLLQVGLRPWQVKNMLRYRAKGGKYRKPEDIRKLYGMTDTLYASLEPWITIPEEQKDTTFDTLKVRVGHEKKDTVLELNLADTASLQYIRGIGPVLAWRIVQYRQQLGGFVSVDQLAEVEGVPAESVAPFFTVDTSLIRILNVNHASVKQLSKHPYILYEQAVQINDLRHRRGINGEEDLLKQHIFSLEELERVRPYLSFEK